MGEVVPFMVMVAMEGCTIGLTILAKTAITNGMSPLVFVVYTNALASLLLLPFSFIFRCWDTDSFFFLFFLLPHMISGHAFNLLLSSYYLQNRTTTLHLSSTLAILLPGFNRVCILSQFPPSLCLSHTSYKNARARAWHHAAQRCWFLMGLWSAWISLGLLGLTSLLRERPFYFWWLILWAKPAIEFLLEIQASLLTSLGLGVTIWILWFGP